MMLFELNGIMFLVRCLKQPSSCLDFGKFVKFSSSVETRSASHNKIKHTKSKNNHSRHFYFNRIPRLWNSLPPFDLSLSTNAIKSKVKAFLWSHFESNFTVYDSCSFHFLCPCQTFRVLVVLTGNPSAPLTFLFSITVSSLFALCCKTRIIIIYISVCFYKVVLECDLTQT